MKKKKPDGVLIAAYLLLAALILAVGCNTYFVGARVRETLSSVEAIDPTADPARILTTAEGIYADFMKKERFISLTVSHDDLTDVEGCFASLIGYARAGDATGITESKSRLTDALRHLGRLAEIGIDRIL